MIRFKTFPKLKIKKNSQKRTVTISNPIRGAKITFEGDDALKLLHLFESPQPIKKVIEKNLEGSPEKYDKIIQHFIDWGFFIIDLQMNLRDCPLCDHHKFRLLLSIRDPFFESNFDIGKCLYCGFVFLNPAPSQQATDYLYNSHNYYSKLSLQSKLGYEIKTGIDSNRKRENLVGRFLNLHKPFSLMDVGCGIGDFLIYMSDKYKCYSIGIDKDPVAINSLSTKRKNIKGIKSGFADIGSPFHEFDAITMWGYLEHDLNPLKSIEKSYDYLKAGGILIIEVPNIESRLASINLKLCPYLHPPFHLSHFSPRTLIQVCKSAGYTIEDLIFDRTGGALMKYSELLLATIVRSKFFYSYPLIDFFVYMISRPILILEKYLDLRGKMILVARKK